jgi:hypothetical protein
LSHKYIFGPLGMQSSFVGIDTAASLPGDARGYRHHMGSWREEQNAVHWGASAGIVSTAEDLLKWAGVLRVAAYTKLTSNVARESRAAESRAAESRVAYTLDGAPASIDELTLEAVRGILRTTAFNDGSPAIYASGISHLRDGDRALLTHSGALRGWRSILMYFTQEDTSIVVFMNRTNSPQGKLTRSIGMQIAEALDITPIGRPQFAKPRKAAPAQQALPPAAAGVYVSREQGLLIELGGSAIPPKALPGAKRKAEAQPSWLFSHLDRAPILKMNDAAKHAALTTFATEDGHLRVSVDAAAESEGVSEAGARASAAPAARRAPVWLDMREENIHVPMQPVIQEVVSTGPFAEGGRYWCAPLESELDVQINGAEVDIGFKGLFGLGIRYPLSVVSAEVAWFDLMRGVDESPPGRVMVYWDAKDNALELSCALARRMVFRVRGQ